jgi:hypothetical protein
MRNVVVHEKSLNYILYTGQIVEIMFVDFKIIF